MQLYIHDLVSMPVRPVMELKDFVRLTLQPGETRTVRFRLTSEKLAAFDLEIRRGVPPGACEVMIGTSSQEFLKARFRVGP